MPKPPTFDQLIDQLADQAADFLKEQLSQFIPQFPDSRHNPVPRRVKGAQKAQKRGPAAPRSPGVRQPRAGERVRLRTAYTVLGVDPKADQEVVAAAYKAMARKWHPDTNKDLRADVCLERMKELNVAWEILKDPVKRHQYDRGMGL